MGEDSINVVRYTLAQRERWSDAPYLTRMLFARMTQGNPEGTTGYGISTYMCDNEYPVIVLNPQTQTVVLEDAPWGEPLKAITPPVSFETFTMCGAETNPTFADVAVDMGAKLVTS
jgi:predicted CoA-binding protein